MSPSMVRPFALVLLACALAPLAARGQAKPANAPAPARVAGKVLVKLRAAAPELPAEKEGPLRWEKNKAAAREHPLHGTFRRLKAQDGRRLFPKREAQGKPQRLAALHDLPERKALERWYELVLPNDADLDAALAELRRSGSVEFAEPVLELKLCQGIPPPITDLPDGTTDPGYEQQWHHTSAHVQAGWNHLKESGVHAGGTPDVVVAVIDTGVDATHPDLVANMWTNGAEIPANGIDDDGNGFKDDIHGCNVVGGTTSHSGDSADYHGHGSHVAGIIAATAFNGAGGVGVAFNTRIMAVRAAQYSGVITTQDAAEGIVYATEQGAEVINMSWGGYGRSQVMEDALAVALNQAVLCAAAGNDAAMAPLYPAALPYVVGVMASSPSKGRAWFSNFGPWYEVMAPGEGIYSSLPNAAWAKWSGTSMATPVVSGVAALMRSFFWQRDIYSSRFLMGSIVHSKSFNSGVVDAYKALTEPPTPGVDLYENWLFDDTTVHPDCDDDGRIDAGETVHIGIELINRSGQADNVVATLTARAEGAVMDDPYVTISTNIVSYQDMGPFNLADNGFVYDTGGELVGVTNPFVVTVSEDCPNDHVIPFVLTTTFYDGWDPENTTPFTRVARFEYIVQRGKNVPTVIATGETVTLDEGNLWIVGGPVLVEAGATLRVTAGAQVQWGAISDDPYNPGPKSGYVTVRGTMSVEGSQANPVWFYPSYLVSGQQTKITVETGGVCDMSYVTVQNPYLTNFNNIDHADLIWDAYASKVEAQIITNTSFQKFRGGGNITAKYSIANSLFDAGWISPSSPRISNSVFLQDNENNKPLNYSPPVTYDSAWLMAGIIWPAYRNGYTYGLVKLKPNVDFIVAEWAAHYFGGHQASIHSADEESFLESYFYSASQPLYNPSWHTAGLGLFYDVSANVYKWYDGTPFDYQFWAAGQPVNLLPGSRTFVSFHLGSTGFGWRVLSNYPDSNQNWAIARLPGTWTQAQWDTEFASGRVTQYVREHNTGNLRNNAFLSKYWDPVVSRWMRITTSGAATGSVNLKENFWGTANTVLIDHAIVDYYDNFTSPRADYGTPPAQGFATTWPFVQGVQINGVPADTVPTLNTGPATFTVTFNRDMDPAVVPFVTFGPSSPFTDFTVKPVDTSPNGWVDARTWQGTFYVVPVTGDGYHQMRISGAVAADDPWLVSGYDVGRYRFNVETMGVAAMTLQAEGREGAIHLMWQQNDYELIAGYNVYRSTSAGGTYTRLNTTIIPVGQESYTDTAVTPGVPMFYKFTVVLSDFTESAFSNVASAAAIDTIAPVITHTPVTSAPPGGSVRVTAMVTDNLAVQGATVFFRPWGGSGDHTALAMLNTEGNEWTANIPGAAVLPPGVEYYLTATDGISTTYKGSPASPYVISVSSAPSLISVTPSEGPAAGGTLVNLAGTLFQTGAEVLFGGIPASDVQVLSGNQITCTAPPHFPATVDVTVTNPDASAATKLNGFRYLATDVVLSLPDSSGDQGTTVEIPVNLSNVSGLGAVDGTVTYSSSILTAQSVRVGTLTQGWTLSSNLATAGKVRFALANATSVGGSGSVVIITFLVKGTASSQSTLGIESALLNGGAISWTGSPGTFTVSGRFQMGGTVRYFTGNGPVRGVDLTLSGSGLHTAQTGDTGTFELSEILTGSYTLTPEKNGETVEITAYDASLVLQKAVGSTTLTANQLIAADVNRDGAVNSMDAFYILQKSAELLGTPFPGAGRTWDFVPGQRSYAQLNANQTAQDFTAILLGDVSGNWLPPAPPPGEGGMMSIAGGGNPPVEILTTCTPLPHSRNHVVRLLTRSASPCILSADLLLQYRASARLLSSSAPVSAAVNDTLPGSLRVALAGAEPLPAGGALLTLVFEDDLAPAVQLLEIELNENALATHAGSDLGAFDQDGDGLPDLDETEYLHTSATSADSDQDGFGDYAEIITGTDPASAADRFTTSVETEPGESPALRISWASLPGRIYTVEEAPSPAGPWEPVHEIAGDGAEQSFTVPIDAQCGFLRLAIRLEQ